MDTPARTALGLRDASRGRDLTGEIEATGRRALPLQMDVTRLAEVDAAVDRAIAHFGRVDILVNNVGGGPEGRAEDVTEEDFDLTLDLNVKATFFTSQKVGRHMIGRGYGRIVNLSSQAGFIALLGEAVLLPRQSRGRPSGQMPGDRMGPAQHHGQRRGPTFIATPAPSRRSPTRRSAPT